MASRVFFINAKNKIKMKIRRLRYKKKVGLFSLFKRRFKLRNFKNDKVIFKIKKDLPKRSQKIAAKLCDSKNQKLISLRKK